jgi:outer membrane protein assembly factor BamB
MRTRGIPAALAIALALTFGACGATKHHGPGPSQSGGGPGWRAPNADLSSTRWVSSSIDARSVSRLSKVWSVPVASYYATTPVISNGVLYTQDFASTVYAIDLATGHVRWKRTQSAADGGNSGGGPNGVAIGDGRVYGTTAWYAFALDAQSGRPLWKRRVIRDLTEGIDMAPAYANGTLLVSTVPSNSIKGIYAGGARGVMWALDGASGSVRWHWDTVPRDLWGKPRVNSGGGMWYTPAVEPGGVYLSTGNPGPVPGTKRYPWGSSRPGPNRWTNSIVKLDPRTGKLLWARQPLPHDLYDWDLECPAVLVRARGRALAITGGKMGFVYAFDRSDGRLVWKRSVGLHNGHDHDNLRSMSGKDLSTAQRRVLPGNLGGIETPMAADGDTLYVPVVNLWSRFGLDEIVSSESTATASGEMVALDLATGRVKWDRKLPNSPFGAATVTNDLVFTTTYDGTVWALRTDTGKVAWTTELPFSTNAPVAIAGDVLVTAASLPYEGTEQPQVIAYRLDGGPVGG